MTFNYKTRIDPKTGRAETYTDDATDAQVAAEKLARDKRELRDMLAGNLPFHADPNAAPLPTGEAKELPPIEWDGSHPDVAAVLQQGVLRGPCEYARSHGLALDSGEFIPAEELNRA